MEEENLKLETQSNQSMEKEETCKILFIGSTKISVNFKGYGIEIPLESNIEIDNNLKEIKVYYIGDIGQPDFKYYIKVEE